MTVQKLFDDYDAMQARARPEARREHERQLAQMDARRRQFEADRGGGWGAAITAAVLLIAVTIFALWTVTAIHKAAADLRMFETLREIEGR